MKELELKLAEFFHQENLKECKTEEAVKLENVRYSVKVYCINDRWKTHDLGIELTKELGLDK